MPDTMSPSQRRVVGPSAQPRHRAPAALRGCGPSSAQRGDDTSPGALGREPTRVGRRYETRGRNRGNSGPFHLTSQRPQELPFGK